MELLQFIAKLLDTVLDYVPHGVARQLLDEAAVRRANAIADLAEAEKFSK